MNTPPFGLTLNYHLAQAAPPQGELFYMEESIGNKHPQELLVGRQDAAAASPEQPEREQHL